MAGIRQKNNRPGRYRISTGKSAGSARSSHSSRTAADDERGGLHFGVKGRTVKKTRKNTTIDPAAAQEREETRKALEARRKRKEQNIREQKEAAANRVSYVRKPISRRSLYSLGFLVVAAALGAYGIYGGVTTNGQAALSSAAFGLCSILFDISSLWYGIISFLEEEKNHIIARITVILSGLMLAGWIITIIMGIRG